MTRVRYQMRMNNVFRFVQRAIARWEVQSSCRRTRKAQGKCFVPLMLATNAKYDENVSQERFVKLFRLYEECMSR